MGPTVKDDQYLLSRDYIDVSRYGFTASSKQARADHCPRLNLQHSLWTQMFGYLLHPDIDTTNKDLKIADVGTGTGYVNVTPCLLDLYSSIGNNSNSPQRMAI